jgi:mono/diheme cytochrome c family protein
MSKQTAFLLVVGVSLLAGCGRQEPVRFRLNMEGRNRADVPRDKQEGLVDALTAAFGTPDEPYAFPQTGLDVEKLKLAAGASMSQQTGTRHGLYRQHCAHCHGVSGDGLGPTAAFLNPFPRDYRKGIFKFIHGRRCQGDAGRSEEDDRRRRSRHGDA